MTAGSAVVFVAVFALGYAVAWAAWRSRPVPEITESKYGRIKFLWQIEEDAERRACLREILEIIEGGDNGDL